MTDKQLRSLSKVQLFQLLHEQELEIERLTAENEKLSEQRLSLEQVGTLAEAAITVSGIVEAAQSAADVYMDSILKLEADKLAAIPKLEEEARQRAVKAAELKNAESKAQIDRLLIEMLGAFDSQLYHMSAMKEELSELMSKNDLYHLISDKKAKEHEESEEEDAEEKDNDYE